jgi:hypothetical protein
VESLAKVLGQRTNTQRLGGVMTGVNDYEIIFVSVNRRPVRPFAYN